MRSTTHHRDSAALRAALRRVHRILRSRVRLIQDEPDEAFGRDFPRMVAALEAGLRHEEEILEMLGHCGLHERRAENAMILCALHRVSTRVERGWVEPGRQLAAAVDDMLALHRLGEAPGLAAGIGRLRERCRDLRARLRAIPTGLRPPRRRRQRP